MTEVKVTKIEIGLWNAISLMVTFAIAAIPAMLIIGLISFLMFFLITTLGIR